MNWDGSDWLRSLMVAVAAAVLAVLVYHHAFVRPRVVKMEKQIAEISRTAEQNKAQTASLSTTLEHVQVGVRSMRDVVLANAEATDSLRSTVNYNAMIANMNNNLRY